MASPDPAEGLILRLVVLFGACVVFVATQSVNVSSVPTTPSSTVPTTPAHEVCASLNKSCQDCVSKPECLWCPSKDGGCVPYPVGQIIPHSDYCDLGEARWGVCWMNYKAMLICMGVIAGVLLVSLFCCIYCCCCKSKGNKKKYEREDAKLDSDREERQMRHAERRADRQTKYDDIRKKYGIGHFSKQKDEGIGEYGGTSKYEKFDNEEA